MLVSLLCSATALVAALAPLPQLPANGIQNGDFSSLNTAGSPVDGGYWVGAEGKTFLDTSGNRWLRFPGSLEDRVYQKVGTPGDKAGTATVDVSVRVQNLLGGQDEGWLTLSEAADHYSLNWLFLSSSLCSQYVQDQRWGFYEGVPGSILPMTVNCVARTVTSAQVPATGNSVEYGAVHVTNTPLIVGWRAPLAGTVRVLVRPWRIAGYSGADVVQQIQLDTNDIFTAPDPTTVRTDTLFGNAYDGPVIFKRIAVQAGEWIYFRLAPAAQIQGSTTVWWTPTIAYEGRRLTYRFGPDLGAGTPPPPPYVNKSVAANTWTTFTLPAGSDFASYWGIAPVAPLDIELSVPGTNARKVEFDDVRCWTTIHSTTEPELRNAILAEARWARDNWRLVRDRNAPSPGTEQLGSLETPYVAHRLHLLTGPSLNTCGGPTTYGQEPPGLWELLDRSYDDLDYDDYFWLREQEMQNLSPFRLPYTKYDCCTDQYVTSPGLVSIGSRDEIYTRTNDPTFLDLDYHAVKLMANNGVIGSNDPNPPSGGCSRAGMICTEGFDTDTGLTPTGPFLLDNWQELDGPSALIVTYVRCKQFNASHPWINPPRYSPAVLDSWLQKAQAALQAAAANKFWAAAPPTCANWGGSFQSLVGSFNDRLGYMSIAATLACKALDSLPPAAGSLELALRDSLRTDFLISGVNNFLPFWEQGTSRYEFAPGDQFRPWPAFQYLVSLYDANSTCCTGFDLVQRNRSASQLVAAAFHTVRFQHAGGTWMPEGGIWTNAPQDPFELLHLGGGFGGGLRAPELSVSGIGTALRIPPPSLSATQRQALVAWLYEYQRIAKGNFKAPYGYYWRVDQQPVNPPNPDLAGAEWRSINNFVAVLDSLNAGLPQPPTATILDTVNLSLPPPPNQTASFRFRIHVPTATTQADLKTALEDRTRIELWTYPGGGAMASRAPLWPKFPALFSSPVYDTVAKTATVSYASGMAAGAGTFKFTIRTWDPNGQWTRDTSYQANW